MELVSLKSPIEEAFSKCDELLKDAVENISNVILNPGALNVDFADIKEILKNGGVAFSGPVGLKEKTGFLKQLSKLFIRQLINFH